MSDSIQLKRKDDISFCNTDIVVFDEVFQGLLTGSFWVPVFTGADNGCRVLPTSFLFENYKWPSKNGIPGSRICSFMQGHSPALQIEYYEDDSIEV